jgi:hypothetical protein
MSSHEDFADDLADKMLANALARLGLKAQIRAATTAKTLAQSARDQGLTDLADLIEDASNPTQLALPSANGNGAPKRRGRPPGSKNRRCHVQGDIDFDTQVEQADERGRDED